MIVIFFSPQVAAVKVMAVNAEWFWDSDQPHEGRVDYRPTYIPLPSMLVQEEARAIASAVVSQNADVVALSEIESQSVAEMVKDQLGVDWSVVFEKGRDNNTGQDVAILTRLAVNRQSVDNLKDFPKACSLNKRVCAKPSKVISVVLTDANQSYLIVAAHLVSKRRNNDERREAQAATIRGFIDSNRAYADHMIVLGDFNDVPESNTLRILRGSGQGDFKLIQPANTEGANRDWSYLYKNKKQLIDHILVSPTFTQSTEFYTIDLGDVSDHRAVVGEFR